MKNFAFKCKNKSFRNHFFNLFFSYWSFHNWSRLPSLGKVGLTRESSFSNMLKFWLKREFIGLRKRWYRLVAGSGGGGEAEWKGRFINRSSVQIKMKLNFKFRRTIWKKIHEKLQNFLQSKCFITAHKRSLGQGNVSSVCHSVHRGGGTTYRGVYLRGSACCL